jgi:hypothetical protein
MASRKFSRIVIVAHKRTLSELNWAMDFYCLSSPRVEGKASVSFSFFTSLEGTLIHSLESRATTFPIVISYYFRSLLVLQMGDVKASCDCCKTCGLLMFSSTILLRFFSCVIPLNHVTKRGKSCEPSCHQQMTW